MGDVPVLEKYLQGSKATLIYATNVTEARMLRELCGRLEGS
jgi:hypothetical protein